MVNVKNAEMRLPSLDELFSSQKERDDAKLKRIYEIPLDEIDPFPEHPFKVKDDEDMQNLIESIRTQGVITPCMVRRKEDGRYELVSGHRRKRACELLGMKTLRCEVAHISRDEATILMTESNFQRSRILPSEKAFAYRMRLEAMKRLPGRPSRNAGPVGPNYRSDEALAEQVDDSARQIKRYIRLTELIPELLELVDDGKIALRPAVELSYIPKLQQGHIWECIEMEQCTPSHAQAIRMRKMADEGRLTPEAIEAIIGEAKPNQKERIVLKGERFKNLFPPDLPPSKREDYVAAAMEYYARHRDRQRTRDDAR